MSARFQPLKGVSTAVLALTLCACGSMAPDYQRPAAPVAASFGSENAGNTAASAI